MLDRALRAEHPLARGVLREVRATVEVDDGALCARGNRNEVAVPRRQLLEAGEELLALRAELRAARALVGFTGGERRAEQLGVDGVLVTLTHTDGVAGAVVVLEG